MKYFISFTEDIENGVHQNIQKTKNQGIFTSEHYMDNIEEKSS